MQEQLSLPVERRHVQPRPRPLAGPPLSQVHVVGRRLLPEPAARHDRADLARERLRGAGAGRVDPRDRPADSRRPRQGVQHRHQGRGADARGDEDHRGAGPRDVGRVEGELPARVRQLHRAALLVAAAVQQARDQPVALPLDAHPVGAPVRGPAAQAVLPALQVAQLRREDPQAHVLARQEAGQGDDAVLRLEVEADDVLRLWHLPGDSELPPPRPALVGLVQLLLPADEDRGQDAVRSGPGIHDVGRGCVTEHLADRPDQVRPHDVVLLGSYVQTGVLLCDALDGVRQLRQVVDVHGIGDDRAGKGSGLTACDLRGMAEDVFHGGVGPYHIFIHGSRDCLAMGLKHRDCGLDDGQLRRGQRRHRRQSSAFVGGAGFRI